MRNNFIWKQYIMTLLLGPAILIGYWMFLSEHINSCNNAFQVYALILLFSVPFSLPALILYSVFAMALKRQKMDEFGAELVLTAFTIGCIYLTFLLLDESSFMIGAHAYASGVAVSMVFIHFLWRGKLQEQESITEHIDGEEFENLD